MKGFNYGFARLRYRDLTLRPAGMKSVIGAPKRVVIYEYASLP